MKLSRSLFLGHVLLAATLFQTQSGFAEGSLEEKLESLKSPENELPQQADAEQLYAVQTRYSPLRLKHEILVGGGKNFTPDSMLVSNELTLGYRFHFSDDWSVGVKGSMVFNDLSNAGRRIYVQEKVLPDAAYAKTKTDLTFGYNIFYGKFRLSSESTLYFDLYTSAGPAYVQLDSGWNLGAVANLGMAFWLGQRWSVRASLQDYYYKEVRLTSSSMSHNFVGQIELGALLGGSQL